MASAATAKRNSRVIWLLLSATFVVILNETIMNVALRDIMLDLHIDARTGQWLTTVFMLTTAVVIPITGFLLQRFNTRPVYITAMTSFSLGTLLAALAPNFEVLLAARIVQACGTAIMLPLLMTTLMTLVPAASRGKTMGNVSIVISVAPAIGPTISGVILSTLTWRWMFWLVLPISVGMLLFGIWQMKNVTEPKRVPLDVFSVVLSAFGFGGLVYGLSLIGAGDQAGSASQASSSNLLMAIALSVGGAALVGFIVRQLALQRSNRALLDLRTFRAPIFSVAVAMMALATATLFGVIILIPIYLQQVLGVAPLETGLLLLPGGLVMGLLAPFVGRLYDRFGPMPLAAPGSIIVSAGMWALTTVGATTSPYFVLAAHVTLSIGLALLFTPLFTAGLGAVKPSLYSHGSAIVGTVQQMAGAAGTALFVTVMSVQAASLAGTSTAQQAAAGGMSAAFFVGAILSLFVIVAAFFIRKPPDDVGD
ncbi:DHA2 family efflux MFS transporter permease subunit [Rathayibacter soli]|uniref:DHA2 family efflux MFS transporter permease subunit n=1 Tax=Rathayibacter soli TaxID=3144168 RepID=UPI0027E43580|nr:DHA2 family efflux MFS transporter permease subunit [Glaciibacter superstes]